MTINNNFVAVPAQSKSLDTNTVTTAAGVVHRQVVSLASSDTTGTYLGFNSDSAKAYLTNTSLPLPTGASTSALQTAGNSSLSSIDSKITAVNTGAVVVSSSVLPTGASTSALQTTGNSSLSSIDSKITVVNTGAVVVSSSVLPTGASTSALQTTGNNSLSSIDGKTATLVSGRVPVDGSAVTQPISAASLPLPTGAATQTTLSSIDAKLSALGQNTMSASTPVVLSSNHSDISVKNKSSSFSNITTTGTTTIKSGAGIFRRLVINTKGVLSNTFTIYDNTAGSGTVIATVDTVNSTGSLEYGLAFSTGLTIVSASGTSANATVIYE